MSRDGFELPGVQRIQLECRPWRWEAASRTNAPTGRGGEAKSTKAEDAIVAERRIVVFGSFRMGSTGSTNFCSDSWRTRKTAICRSGRSRNFTPRKILGIRTLRFSPDVSPLLKKLKFDGLPHIKAPNAGEGFRPTFMPKTIGEPVRARYHLASLTFVWTPISVRSIMGLG